MSLECIEKKEENVFTNSKISVIVSLGKGKSIQSFTKDDPLGRTSPEGVIMFGLSCD